MKPDHTHNRPSHIPYCYPSVLSTKSLRATFAETLPIRCDLTFTLWKDWSGQTPPNEVLFKAWNSLDKMICNQFLHLGNGWRTSRKRPKWMVVLEQKPGGNKHLHGIVQCLPAIEKTKYVLAFKEAHYKCHHVRGFVPEVDPPRNEVAWKMYLTKLQKSADQSVGCEFDFRFSPNFPHWKHTEM